MLLRLADEVSCGVVTENNYFQGPWIPEDLLGGQDIRAWLSSRYQLDMRRDLSHSLVCKGKR